MLPPESGAGKVNIGQEAIVKLKGYPYQEYGSVYGKIKRISAFTNEQSAVADPIPEEDGSLKRNTYLVILEFPKGLTPNYGLRLIFILKPRERRKLYSTKER